MVTGTTDKTKQDTGKVEGDPQPGTGLDGASGGTGNKSEKTYRQSEVDALLGKSGQKLKAQLDTITAERDSLKTERDTLKAQVDTINGEITESKQSIEALNKEIDTLSADDPEKKALVALRKERQKELDALKADRKALEGPRKEIEAFKRSELIYAVADEYGLDDPEAKDKFKTSADRLNISGREGLQALAETMGLKLKDEQSDANPNEPKAPDSGRNSGGSESLEGKSPDELFRIAYSKKR